MVSAGSAFASEACRRQNVIVWTDSIGYKDTRTTKGPDDIPESTNKMMKTLRLKLSLLTTTLLVASLAMISMPVGAQDSSLALNRGYRAGYTDGYMAGYTDISEGLSRDFRRHSEYSSANRTYTQEFGKLEDFQNGYRQGFERGYAHGFERRPFDSAVPSDLKKTDSAVPAVPPSVPMIPDVPAPEPEEDESEETEEAPTEETESEQETETEKEEEPEPPTLPTPEPTPAPTPQPTPVVSPEPEPTPSSVAQETSSTSRQSDGESVIASDTVLILEMETRISSDGNSVGDRFKAKVVSPLGLTDAIVEGRIARIRQPGRIFRRAELTLVFDRITTKDGRTSELPVILTEVMPVRTDNVRAVDSEGTIGGKVFDRADGIRIASVTGSAVTVGAIVGGPGGAAVGAGIGALANLASTLSRRGKEITIHQLQQLRIRTTAEIRLK